MEDQIIQVENEQWAIVELMGHGLTAGRITKPTDWGGLMRVDVPVQNKDNFTTELYGISALYRVKFVSEEIARAYAPAERDIQSYDSPIITRDEHQSVVRALKEEIYNMQNRNQEIERRLTQIDTLPIDQLPAGQVDTDEAPF